MFGPWTLTAISAGYLLWYGWRVFVKDKGSLGGLGLSLATVAILEIFMSLIDL
ncbi:MAG: hypothetical protein ABJN34_04620 [Litoreibacter sp.]|uniref:hypothetical protein n=1 Tax=Litoreibacter sp. TaxID=1969459 RepID=UPI003298CDF6